MAGHQGPAVMFDRPRKQSGAVRAVWRLEPGLNIGLESVNIDADGVGVDADLAAIREEDAGGRDASRFQLFAQEGEGDAQVVTPRIEIDIRPEDFEQGITGMGLP